MNAEKLTCDFYMYKAFVVEYSLSFAWFQKKKKPYI